MNGTLARAIDQFFIAFVLKKRRHFVEEESDRGPESEPEKHLQKPELFYLPHGNPGLKLLLRTSARSGKRAHIHRLCFESPFTTPWPENNILHATYFESPDVRSPHLIVIHGYQDTRNIFHNWLGRKLLKKGVSSLVLELPYHMRRAPRGTFNGEYFVYRGIDGTLQAVRQAVAEVCASVAWLKGSGRGHVGIFGSSLGGLIAALSCAVEPEIDFCILNVPAVDLMNLTHHSPAALPIKRVLEKKGTGAMAEFESLASILTPRLLKPLLGKDDILAIQALHDRFVSPQQIEELRESWGGFRVTRLPQGHISTFIFSGRTVLREVANFVLSR